MNKALLLMLGASVAMNVYLVNVEVVVKDELDREYIEEPERDRITIAQSAVEKKEAEKDSRQEGCKTKVVEKIVYKEALATEEEGEALHSDALKTITEKDLESMSRNEMSELLASYREDWKQKSKNFFEFRLGLSPSQQSDYENLKSAMEEEISQMLRTSDPGWQDGRPRAIGPEEMVEMGRIHQKYADKLKNAFGPAAYDEYISFRESYNRGLSKDKRGFFGIQF